MGVLNRAGALNQGNTVCLVYLPYFIWHFNIQQGAGCNSFRIHVIDFRSLNIYTYFQWTEEGPSHSTFDSRIHAVFWQNSRGHAC